MAAAGFHDSRLLKRFQPGRDEAIQSLRPFSSTPVCSRDSSARWVPVRQVVGTGMNSDVLRGHPTAGGMLPRLGSRAVPIPRLIFQERLLRTLGPCPAQARTKFSLSASNGSHMVRRILVGKDISTGDILEEVGTGGERYFRELTQT